MKSPLESLLSMGLELPPPPVSGGNYLPWLASGDLLFLSGVISKKGDRVISGRLGADLDVATGYHAARQCALIQLATLHAALGDWSRLDRIVSLNGYVRCTPEFPDAPKVVNGASDLLVALFGESGRHVRAAVGVTSLPACAAVEVQMVVRVLPL